MSRESWIRLCMLAMFLVACAAIQIVAADVAKLVPQPYGARAAALVFGVVVSLVGLCWPLVLLELARERFRLNVFYRTLCLAVAIVWTTAGIATAIVSFAGRNFVLGDKAANFDIAGLVIGGIVSVAAWIWHSLARS